MNDAYFINQVSPWAPDVVQAWRRAVEANGKKRDYGEIISRINALSTATHVVETYGTTSDGHPLLRVTSGNLTDTASHNQSLIIIGGVHGYEPSGIKAAIKFVSDDAVRLRDWYNVASYPCISPWAYEYDQRWTKNALDPNRHCLRAENIEPVDECLHFMNAIESHGVYFDAAIDLHETPDRDVELRQLRTSRYGDVLPKDYREIPQGFYLILTQHLDLGKNAEQFELADEIVSLVRNVSPIASEKTILSGKTNFGGLILSPSIEGTTRKFLEAHADKIVVTEVYPDHKDMTPQKAIEAQVKAIYGLINYVSRNDLHFRYA